jgi:hypothetical protein
MLPDMSEALFAAERRFELRALYGFNGCIMGVAIFALIHRDWLLLAICVAAFFVNGLIGSSLRKNKHKSFSQLAAGSIGEPEVANEAPGIMDRRILTRATIEFMLLAVLTGGAIAFHFAQPWGVIVATASLVWLVSILLTIWAFWLRWPEIRTAMEKKAGIPLAWRGHLSDEGRECNPTMTDTSDEEFHLPSYLAQRLFTSFVDEAAAGAFEIRKITDDTSKLHAYSERV